MRASIAGNERWARTDNRAEATAPGRRAASERFQTLVDPDGKLPPEERARRADSARKAHMTRLALRSAQSRRAAADARQAARSVQTAARMLTKTATELDQVANDTDSELKAIGGSPDARAAELPELPNPGRETGARPGRLS